MLIFNWWTAGEWIGRASFRVSIVPGALCIRMSEKDL